MRVHSEKGIIIHHTQYSDHSVIAKIYLETLGMRACIVRGVGRKKGSKASFLRPLTRVQLQLSESNKSNILGVKEITLGGISQVAYGDMARSSLSMFLAEVLLKTIEENYSNDLLFDYLWESIDLLSTTDCPQNFHLVFLMNLTGFYGFRPQSPEANEEYFDLENGTFSMIPSNFSLSAEESAVWLRALGTKFDDLPKLNLSGLERKKLLNNLIDYYRLHLSGLKQVNSHAILEAVFHD